MKIIRLGLIIVLWASNSTAAEFRSFASSKVYADGSLPSAAGMPYVLPKSNLRVELTLYVEKQTVVATHVNADGSRKHEISAPIYCAKADLSTNAASLSFCDDNALEFYLTTTSGLLTDVEDLSVSYFTNSLRLASVSVKYSDKTAEVIQGTVKLLGETAGIVASHLVGFSSAGGTVIMRERVEGVNVAVPLTFEKLTGITTLQLVNEQKRLEELLNSKLASSAHGKAVSMERLEIRLISSIQDPSEAVTSDRLLKNADKTKFGNKRYPFIPGVVYRTVGDAVVILQTETRDIQESDPSQTGQITAVLTRVPVRIPEAGKFAWVELSSKVFRTVNPSIDFNDDGSLRAFRYGSTTKTAEMFAAISQINTSSVSVLQQLDLLRETGRTNVSNKLKENAQLELEETKMTAKKDQLESEIEELETRIAGTKEQATLEQLNGTLRQKKSELTILSKQLEILREFRIKIE